MSGLPGAPQSNARGILLYMAAVFFMSSMDMLVKAASSEIHTVQTIWARYAGQTLVVTLIVLPRLRSVVRTRYPKLQFLRSLVLLIGTTFFFFSLSYLGLAEATAIMDINPVLITLGAALFLGERFGPRRAFGVGAALIGALIVIRPGSAVFSLAALLPVGGAICYTAFVLMTRRVGRDEDSWTSLFYTALLGAVIVSFIVPFFWTRPDLPTAALMAGIALAGALGQLLMIRALIAAEASAIAPFSYVGLLFATIWGVVLFDEFPDAATYAGALVIVGAGLYVWRRETRDAARAKAAASLHKP